LTRSRRGVASAVLVLGVSACGGGGGGDGDSASDDRDRSSSTTTEASGETTPAEPGSSGESQALLVPGDVTGPVDIDATAEPGRGVEVRLSRIRSVEAEANLPGEIGGLAVAVTVEVANGSRRPVDLDHVTVDLVTSEGVSASPVLDPDLEPLTGALEAGRTRSGTYTFSLAADERADVSVLVRYSADSPTVVFTGSLPDA
jgi:hypothetical protein